MDSRRDFKVISMLLLFLGVMDIALLVINNMGEMKAVSALSDKGLAFVIGIAAIVVIIALAKLYMGYMGIRYCNGTGKGTFHITLAKIGLVLAVIAVVLSVMDMTSGGTLNTVISDIIDVMVIFWYFRAAKRNLY